MRDMTRIALVTGGTSGIGLATARRFLDGGWAVAVVGTTQEKLDRLDLEGDLLARRVDVSRQDQVVDLVRAVEERWGRLDAVFANAGINGVWAPLGDLELDEWERTLSVNLTGTFLTVKHSLPLLRKSGGGSIVVTSSVNGTRMFSNTGATAYACSKGAQAVFTRMVAPELAPDGIRINTICPGWVDTDIASSTEKRDLEEVPHERGAPLTGGGPGRPEQVADLVWFLCSEQASLITGTEVWIDGAQSLVQG